MAVERFDEYFRVQYPRIVNELDVMLGDRDLARDVAQEAFIKQHMKWASLSKLDKPGAWVRKVAVRLAFRIMRRNRRQEALMTDESSVARAVAIETVLDVRSAVLRLSERQRAAVVLHYYRDLPVAVVADTLGCSVSTAKSHLQRARERLAQLLGSYGPEKNS